MNPLNPIMAVAVIASVGVLPLRTRASDGHQLQAPSSGVVVAVDDNNPINVLGKILFENAAARADAGARIEQFLLEADSNGKSFVAVDVDTTALGAVARQWTQETFKVSGGSVTVLYFVVGPGRAIPDWVRKDPVLSQTFPLDLDLEGRLRIALARFTDAGAAQIKKAGGKDVATAFLNTAADEATKVFHDRRPKPVIDRSVDQNDNTGVQPPDTRDPRPNGTTRQYTMEDLYKDGAKVANVAGPKDEHSRTISMKIYTKRIPDGTPNGKLVNEIGIFDITDQPDNIFGQRFPVGSGSRSFVLDDRKPEPPKHKDYELTFSRGKNGESEITFARPGKGGTALKTTVSELYNKRADQVAAMAASGDVVEVGGQKFYVLPQGGAKSGLLFFSKALIDHGAKDPRDLIPTLYSEIGVRGSDGRNENVEPGEKGGPHLGQIDGKEFHLEWNGKLVPPAWEVKDGAGNLPPVIVTPAADPGGGSGPSGGPGPGGGSTPAGGTSIADLEAFLLREPQCKKNPDDTKDIAASLKGKYGVIVCSDPREGLKHFLLVPKSARNPDQQIELKYEGYKLLRARLADHFLVLVFAKQVQYMDLLKQGKDSAGKETGFALSGFVDLEKKEKKSATKFTDTTPFVDALTNYMGIAASSSAVTEIPRRVRQLLGGKPYFLTGGFPGGVFEVNAESGGDVYRIWPTARGPGETPAAVPDPYTGISGPTNAFEGAVSSVDEKFPAELLLPENRKALPMAGRVTADIALYESVDEPKKYFAMFKFDGLDPKDPTKPDGEKEKKTFRQKQFEVFNSSNPLPATFNQQGLVGVAVVKDRLVMGWRFVTGTTEKKGVYAVFQNKQLSGENQQKKADNCVGPLVWWGLANRDAALKVCQDDKF